MSVFSLRQPIAAGGSAVRTGARTAYRWALGRARELSWRRELLLVAVLYGLYELSRGVADAGIKTAIANGRHILRFEQWAHLSPEHWLNDELGRSAVASIISSYDYSTFHYIVTPAVLIWMFRKHKEHYRFARTTLAWSTVVGLIGFYFVPTAPPRLVPHSGITDILDKVSDWGWWGSDGSVPNGLGGLSNQFAAMPSLHVGWALWAGVLIVMYATKPLVRVLGALYPITTTIVVMATGNHYLLDTLAGAAAIGIAALLSKLFVRRRAQDLPAEMLEKSFDDTCRELRTAGGRNRSAA